MRQFIYTVTCMLLLTTVVTAEEISIGSFDPEVRCDGVSRHVQYVEDDFADGNGAARHIQYVEGHLAEGITALEIPNGPTLIVRYEDWILVSYGYLNGEEYKETESYRYLDFFNAELADHQLADWNGYHEDVCSGHSENELK